MARQFHTHIFANQAINRGLQGAMAFVCLAFLLAPIGPAHADNADNLANKVPAEVAQVAAGGFWEANGKSGPYRIIVVTSGKSQKALIASVFLQWLAISEGKGKPEIVKTSAIKEFNDKKLSNVFAFFEQEEKDKITVVFTAYEPKTEKETQIWIEAKGPGKYKVIPPQKSDPEDKGSPGKKK